jgi:hypothetical protein
VPDEGWQRKFADPIEAPDGTRLNTLREAVAYLAKTVPKSERNMPAVTTAAEMLTYAAERGLAWMFSSGLRHLDRLAEPRTVGLNAPRLSFLSLRVCPDTSGRIAEFSEHEAD